MAKVIEVEIEAKVIEELDYAVLNKIVRNSLFSQSSHTTSVQPSCSMLSNTAVNYGGISSI